MATNVVFDSITYSIPAEGDEGWGSSLSAFLIAVGQKAAVEANLLASIIQNDSSVTGDYVDDALNTLQTQSLTTDSKLYSAPKRIFVDNRRDDSYTPDGTWYYPFITLQDGLDACKLLLDADEADVELIVYGSTYTEDNILTIANTVNATFKILCLNRVNHYGYFNILSNEAVAGTTNTIVISNIDVLDSTGANGAFALSTLSTDGNAVLIAHIYNSTLQTANATAGGLYLHPTADIDNDTITCNIYNSVISGTNYGIEVTVVNDGAASATINSFNSVISGATYSIYMEQGASSGTVTNNLYNSTLIGSLDGYSTTSYVTSDSDIGNTSTVSGTTVKDALETLDSRDTLAELTDVSIQTGEPTTNDVLVWDGTYWVPKAYLITPDTRIYVDNRRTDSYTADGTEQYPYTTIQEAVDQADVLFTASATFVELHVLGNDYSETITKTVSHAGSLILKIIGKSGRVNVNGTINIALAGGTHTIEIENMSFISTGNVCTFTRDDTNDIIILNNVFINSTSGGSDAGLVIGGTSVTGSIWTVNTYNTYIRGGYSIRTDGDSSTININLYSTHLEGVTNAIFATPATQAILYSGSTIYNGVDNVSLVFASYDSYITTTSGFPGATTVANALTLLRTFSFAVQVSGNLYVQDGIAYLDIPYDVTLQSVLAKVGTKETETGQSISIDIREGDDLGTATTILDGGDIIIANDSYLTNTTTFASDTFSQYNRLWIDINDCLDAKDLQLTFFFRRD